MGKFHHFFTLIVIALAICLSGASDVEAFTYSSTGPRNVISSADILFTVTATNTASYAQAYYANAGLAGNTNIAWSITNISPETSLGCDSEIKSVDAWGIKDGTSVTDLRLLTIEFEEPCVVPPGTYQFNSTNAGNIVAGYVSSSTPWLIIGDGVPPQTYSEDATQAYETRITDVQFSPGTIAYGYRDDVVTPVTGTRKNLFDAFWKISSMEELGGNIADAQYYSIYYDDFQDGFLFGCYPITQLEGNGVSVDIPQGTSINNAFFVGYDDSVNCGDINYVNYESSVRIGDSFVIAGTSTVNAYAHWETDIDVLATYFINESEINTSVSARNPTLIAYQWARRPDGSLAGQGESIEPVQGFGTSTTEVSDLVDGTYDFLVKFSNVGCGIGASQCPFPLAYIYTTVEIDQGVVTVTGENEIFNNLNPPALSNEYEDCGLSNLSGCLNNTIRFMLIPSEESINGLLTVKEDLDRRIPFVYLAEITTVISEVFNSESTESLDMTLDLGFGEITIISREMIENVPFVGLLNLLLAGMLWLAFATGMYRRVLGIHNRETI